jgi:hypothetical protein
MRRAKRVEQRDGVWHVDARKPCRAREKAKSCHEITFDTDTVTPGMAQIGSATHIVDKGQGSNIINDRSWVSSVIIT